MSTALTLRPLPARRRLALVGSLLLILATMAAASLATAEQAAAARTLRISVNRLYSVSSGDRVVARVRAFDQNGKAIRGARVQFRWTSQGVTRTALRVTGAGGRTSDGRRFDCSAGSSKVTLRIRVTWRWQVRRTVRSFWVSGGT